MRAASAAAAAIRPSSGSSAGKPTQAGGGRAIGRCQRPYLKWRRKKISPPGCAKTCGRTARNEHSFASRGERAASDRSSMRHENKTSRPRNTLQSLSAGASGKTTALDPMGGHCPRRNFPERRRNRNACSKSESESFTECQPIARHKPIPEPIARHKPVTEPIARYKSVPKPEPSA
jgi:hypothetical protein